MSTIDALKSAADLKPETGVMGVCSKTFKAFMDSWPAGNTQTDLLRASGMYNLCPREFVINYWRPRANVTFAGLTMLKMDCGTWFHKYVQDKVLGPMGVLWGTWKNPHVLPGPKTGFHPDPVNAVKGIPECQWEFQEERMYDEKYRIAGHHDGKISRRRLRWLMEHLKEIKGDVSEWCKRLHDVPAGELSLLELKTGTKYGFELLTDDSASIPEYYKMQASIYLGMSGLQETLFLFAERDGWKMKDLIYPYSRTWHDEAKRKARIVWEAIRDEQIPDGMMACRTPYDKRAKTCTHRDVCWNARLNTKEWIDGCKSCKAAAGRKWLDLSEVKFDS